MTAPGIPALLEPIQERLDASQRQWGVQHKTFTNGDYDRTFESDWNFKPFTQDSARELAESMNRSKPVQIARPVFREVGDWTPEGTEDAPTDTARLLAAVKAVDEFIQDAAERSPRELIPVQTVAGLLRNVVEAELRGEA